MNKKLLILSLLMNPAITYSMGRLPSDTATWGDVQNVQSQIGAQQDQINGQQDQITKQNDRLDDLEQTKILIEPVVRLYDGKRIALEAFGDFDVHQGNIYAGGARLTLKLGKSYEAKQIERLRREVDLLRKRGPQ